MKFFYVFEEGRAIQDSPLEKMLEKVIKNIGEKYFQYKIM
jgi:hypothetical protein